MRIIYCCLLALLLLCQNQLVAQLQPPVLTEAEPATAGMSAQHLSLLDSLVQAYMDEGKLPGGVFLVAREGKIVYFKNFGYRSLQKQEPYQLNDIFRIASMTKAITTVGIMQLYEQGKLTLDEPVYPCF